MEMTDLAIGVVDLEVEVVHDLVAALVDLVVAADLEDLQVDTFNPYIQVSYKLSIKNQ